MKKLIIVLLLVPFASFFSILELIEIETVSLVVFLIVSLFSGKELIKLKFKRKKSHIKIDIDIADKEQELKKVVESEYFKELLENINLIKKEKRRLTQ